MTHPVRAAGGPLISVILAVRDVAEYLPECLDSILGQPDMPAGIEVIAVDDASPDGCGAILDARAAADPRLRVIHLADQAGPGPARMRGLAEAAVLRPDGGRLSQVPAAGVPPPAQPARPENGADLPELLPGLRGAYAGEPGQGDGPPGAGRPGLTGDTRAAPSGFPGARPPRTAACWAFSPKITSRSRSLFCGNGAERG